MKLLLLALVSAVLLSACGTDRRHGGTGPCVKARLVDGRLIYVPCPSPSPSPNPSPSPCQKPHRLSAECSFQAEKGIYSAIRKDDAYLVINVTSTEWFSDSNRLVLETNVNGPPEVEGVEHRLVFAPSQVEKIAQTWIKLEVELDEVGASAETDPAFWVRATNEDGCYLGGYFVPFPHGGG